MARSRRLLATIAFAAPIAAAMIGVAPQAAAQSAGYAVNRFEPSERGSDWYLSESLDLRGRARPFGGIVMDWAYRPLVVSSAGGPAATVITDDVVMHAGGGIVFLDRVRASLSLPIALYRHGDDVNGLTVAARAPRERATVSDLRVALDAGLFGEYGESLHVAIGTQVFLPTGARESFTSDGTMRVAPRILIAGEAAAFAYAAKVGFMYRPFDGTFEGRRLGSEAFATLSAGVKVNDRVIFGPEMHTASVVTGRDAFASRSTALGALLGMHVILADDFRVGNAIGTDFLRGDGSPDFRLLASFEYAPDVCVDKDGDGICAKDDACPLVFGVRTNVRSTNGCPAAKPFDQEPKPEPKVEPSEEEEKKEEPPPPEAVPLPPTPTP
jgi:OmpA-OmpF porin, OOP family